jgi:hypothetical protein
MSSGYFPIQFLHPKETKEEDMTDTTVLEERNPATAAFVKAWRAKYERTFDFTEESEKATFYEGVVEMARHIATAADTATLGAMLSVDGVSSMRADAVPHSDSKDD